MLKPPEAASVWLRLARKEPEFKPLYRWRVRRVLAGLRALRRKEGDLFARGGVR